MSYEVRRQDKLSSSGSTTTEALAVRGRSSNRKGRDDQEIKVQIRLQRSEEESVRLVQGARALKS